MLKQAAVCPPAGAQVVVLAESGRKLAQSAVRAGWRPVTLDLYRDLDTQACSERCPRVDDGRGGFDWRLVLAEVRRAAQEGAAGLVYGSGLECQWGLLTELAELLPIWGNDPQVLRLMKTPEQFFALLDDLGIGHPETRFERPRQAAGWLVKPRCGAGGKGVRCCPQSGGAAGEYYQREVPGTPMSVLFLGDGNEAVLLGFNRLRIRGRGHPWPYLFAGALGPVELGQHREIRRWLSALVPAAGLRGLNSLDFMHDGQRCYALEVNARPPASQALYETGFPQGLLAAHVAACQGRFSMPGFQPPAGVRGLRVVYAPWALQVPQADVWPVWCADRPAPGTRIDAGLPVCTVLGSGRDAEAVEAELDGRQADLLALCRRVGVGQQDLP